MALRQAPPGEIVPALLLAALAGCVDAIGFSYVGGFFVSFMSGNTTRLGLDLTAGDWTKSGEIAGVIVSFVLGAALGTSLGVVGPRWRRAALLGLEAALLAAAVPMGGAGSHEPAAMLMATAMGMENEVFVNGRGETRISLTFVSGTLVKIGEGLGQALRGGPRWAWWPFLALWLALLAGVVVGGFAYAQAGLEALFGVCAALLLVATWFVWVDRCAPSEPPSGVRPPQVG